MARGRAPPATRRIDWHGLRAEFISSDCTLEAIAKRADSDYREVKRRASREGWPQLRDEWRRTAAAALAGDRIVAQVTTAAELDRIAHATAIASMNDAARRAERGARDGSDLRANVAALRDAWQLARQAIGLVPEPAAGAAPSGESGGDNLARKLNDLAEAAWTRVAAAERAPADAGGAEPGGVEPGPDVVAPVGPAEPTPAGE